MATVKRNNRMRWPKNSWKRSTSGCVLAENDVGASRSAMIRLSSASTMNVPAKRANMVNLAPRMPQNTSVRPTD